jgi:hypothetical protein
MVHLYLTIQAQMHFFYPHSKSPITKKPQSVDWGFE